MKSELLFTMLGLAILTIVGCLKGEQFTMENLERGVLDGLQKIPEAKQFDEVFGEDNVDHFISYSGPDVPSVWNSEVLLGGRYRLTMQVEVKMSNRFDKVVKVVGQPEFYFIEYRSIEISTSGQISARTNHHPEIPYPFDVATWQRIYEAKGDLSVLNEAIDVKQDALPGFKEFVEAERAPIQKIKR